MDTQQIADMLGYSVRLTEPVFSAHDRFEPGFYIAKAHYRFGDGSEALDLEDTFGRQIKQISMKKIKA